MLAAGDLKTQLLTKCAREMQNMHGEDRKRCLADTDGHTVLPLKTQLAVCACVLLHAACDRRAADEHNVPTLLWRD